MIIGRGEELEALEAEYAKTRPNTYAMYGRRRVGKTTILTEFCKDKPSIFLTGYTQDADAMLNDMAEEIGTFLGRKVEVDNSGDIFRLLSTISSDRKVVVVIDELPDMVRLCPAVPSQLRTFIDTKMKGLNMMIIVCGSSISSMVEELNDGEGPLFERFPIQMKVLPLRYRDARKLNPDLTEEDRIRIYCIAGGIPLYHLEFGSDPPEAGIKRMFLGRTPWGLNETTNLVSMELNPREKYMDILVAIHGGSGLKEISMNSNIPESKCSVMLDKLIFLGIVRKDVCYGMKKRTLYRISDGMIAFCFEVIQRYSSRREFFDADKTYENIREEVASFYGHRFEEVCKEYIADKYDCRSIENWWGSVPVFQNGHMVIGDDGKVVTEDGDIDIVATVRSEGANRMVLGECKFTNKPVGRKELDTLIARGDSLKEKAVEKRYVLFSRSGFSDSFRDYIGELTEPTVDLIDMEMMEEWANSPKNDG